MKIYATGEPMHGDLNKTKATSDGDSIAIKELSEFRNTVVDWLYEDGDYDSASSSIAPKDDLITFSMTTKDGYGIDVDVPAALVCKVIGEVGMDDAVRRMHAFCSDYANSEAETNMDSDEYFSFTRCTSF